MCPICEMPLIAAGTGSSVHDGMLHLQAGAGGFLETAVVERRPLTHTLRTVGKVGYNESGLATITSRVEGYVEKLFVNFTGVEVKKGDHLAEIYSPDLAVAQRELLLGKSDPADHTLMDAARQKMERWGMQPGQIDEFLRSGKVSDRVTLLAPIGDPHRVRAVIRRTQSSAGESANYRTGANTPFASGRYSTTAVMAAAGIGAYKCGNRIDSGSEGTPGSYFTSPPSKAGSRARSTMSSRPAKIRFAGR